MSTKYRFALTLGMLFFSISARPSFAQETKLLSPAEQYILTQVGKGEIADLEEHFKKSEADRVVRASFLEGLVINQNNKYTINKEGIQIIGARIQGTLSLANTEILYYLSLAKCHFDDVDFFQTVFRKGLLIDGSAFDGRVDFSYATVMEGLSANNAHFPNHQELASFDTVKVSGPAFFNDATFAGPVTFVYAVIGGSFEVKRARFTNPDKEVSFNATRIDGGFFAEQAVFAGPVDAMNLRIADNFDGRGTTFKKLADFQCLSLGHNLFLSNATFVGPARFKSATVAGNVELNETQFQDKAEPPQLQEMKASAISVNQTSFSLPPNLTNLTYQNIYPTAGLLELLRNSGSDYSAYTELENCLQRNGYAAEADEVFMEMKRYERRKGLTRFDSVKSYLSEALQGFGRRPQRVVYFDLGIVFIGALLFRRRKMALKSDAKNQAESPVEAKKDLPPYNSFLYSLTLFAPTIDNHYTNNWEPAEPHKKTRGYIRCHKFLGYLLVPLTLAIWSGVFK